MASSSHCTCSASDSSSAPAAAARGGARARARRQAAKHERADADANEGGAMGQRSVCAALRVQWSAVVAHGARPWAERGCKEVGAGAAAGGGAVAGAPLSELNIPAASSVPATPGQRTSTVASGHPAKMNRNTSLAFSACSAVTMATT